MSNWTFSAYAAAAGVVASAGVDVVPAGIVPPDLGAFIYYGGYSVGAAVLASLWSEQYRSAVAAAKLSVTGFLVGGGVGVAVAEYIEMPNVAILAALFASLIAPQFIAKPFQTAEQIIELLKKFLPAIKK